MLQAKESANSAKTKDTKEDEEDMEDRRRIAADEKAMKEVRTHERTIMLK